MASKHNVWMSVSDLMTGLMIIFLFIAIAYMRQVQENQTVLTDYVETRNKLHDKLQSEFKDRPEDWQLVIGKDLSMKFNNPEVLFATGSAELTPKFKSILDEFLPKYIDILINDSLCTRIKEIRIEGHTDDVKFAGSNTDPFIDNARLSQQRSLAVLTYLRQMPALKKYTPDQQKMLEYWFTANGLSYGKSLDKDGEYTFISKQPIDRNLSRRVEFRIVTNGDEILENFVNKNK
ncbi:MAG: OmpA family protein [Paludibacteraceae bacterium]|nr:OmpA family protein [Paludibacteraceae bacterium]